MVTPCLNASKTLDETITSVLTQAGDFEIFFHIQDGGSDDGSISKLESWNDRISNGQYPILCNSFHFSFASEQDRGMYDAITKSFARFDPNPDDWMGWINADDILAYGVGSLLHQIDKGFTEVNWIGGKGAIIKNNTVAVQADRPVNSEIIRQGLCDGVHWEFVQQEGTFFRSSLWRKIDIQSDFCDFKLAGDWNLWRCFARHELFHQTNVPMGFFRQHEEQLSDKERDSYALEIDSTISIAERRKRLGALCEESLVANTIRYDWNSGQIIRDTRSLGNHLRHRNNLLFGHQKKTTPHLDGQADPNRQLSTTEADRNIYTAKKSINAQPHYSSFSGRESGFTTAENERYVKVGSVVGYDHDWQYPAITEKHAFEKARKLLPAANNILYVGFPWATLIDKLNNISDDAHELYAQLLSLNLPKRSGARIVTVSQHIMTLDYRKLFFESGVTDIFWSHAVKQQTSIHDGRKIEIHPFPLYPVQRAEAVRTKESEEREFLYSFVGARSNKWYLTKVRDWILDLLSDDERGFIAGRDNWHYNKIVYDHQIRKKAAAGDQLIDDQASQQFSQIMLKSVFALCPSGSGPNSIRLWEAIGMGAIPVILADTYKPPGSSDLWKAAAVFCEESPKAIRELPDRLAEMAKDTSLIEEKRQALRLLWQLYGPETFIYDIQKFFYRNDVNVDSHDAQLQVLARQINDGALKKAQDYDSFLELCSAMLTLKSSSFNNILKSDTNIRSACAHCLHERGTSVSAQKFQAAQKATVDTSMRVSPEINLLPSKSKVFLFGEHSHRTPLSYHAYRPYFAKHLVFSDNRKTADFLISGFDLDFSKNLQLLSEHASGRPGTQFLIVSEEPLWDTLWSKEYKNKSNHLNTPAGELRYAIANHFNSDIFNFDRIPYFITTNNDFLARYTNYFRRNCTLTVDELLQHWGADLSHAVFYAEKRDSDKYDYELPDQGVHGLSAYRTRLAQNVFDGQATRVGKGWVNQKMRQRLPDWHLDKLVSVDRRALVLSGLENTHQRNYITEKILDAFAALAVPLYYASPEHRIHELLPDGGFINLYGASVEQAVNRVESFSPDITFAQAYLQSQKRLYHLLSDPKNIHLERSRVASTVLREMKELIS